MNLCNKINELLEKDPPLDLKCIPDDLSEHVKNCPACQKTLSFLKELQADKNFSPLSEKEKGDFLMQFQRKALNSSNKSDSSVATTNWTGFKFALTFGIVILLIFIGSRNFFSKPTPQSTVSEPQPSFASIKGKATIVKGIATEKMLVAHSEIEISKDTEIGFESETEPVELSYNNGGKVFLTGHGKMKVLKDGFNAEDGDFKAKFKNLKGIMKVRVPCAVLAIRGTEIHFVINYPKAEIELIEGAADLTPENASAPILLAKGKRICFENSIWNFPQQPDPQKINDTPQKISPQKMEKLNPSNEPVNKTEIHENAIETPVDSLTEPESQESEPKPENESEENRLIGREGFF